MLGECLIMHFLTKNKTGEIIMITLNNNPTFINGVSPQKFSWWDALIAKCKEAITKIEIDVKAVVEKGVEVTKEAPGIIAGIENKAEKIGTDVETALGEINTVLTSALNYLQNNEFLAQILGPKLDSSLQTILEEGISLTDKAETTVQDSVNALPKYAAELDNVFAEIQQFLSRLDQKF